MSDWWRRGGYSALEVGCAKMQLVCGSSRLPKIYRNGRRYIIRREDAQDGSIPTSARPRLEGLRVRSPDNVGRSVEWLSALVAGRGILGILGALLIHERRP